LIQASPDKLNRRICSGLLLSLLTPQPGKSELSLELHLITSTEATEQTPEISSGRFANKLGPTNHPLP